MEGLLLTAVRIHNTLPISPYTSECNEYNASEIFVCFNTVAVVVLTQIFATEDVNVTLERKTSQYPLIKVWLSLVTKVTHANSMPLPHSRTSQKIEQE